MEIQFVDKGFEEAVEKKLNCKDIGAEALLAVKGVLITEGEWNGFGIPWYCADSSAVNLTLPDFIFNTYNSLNNQWEKDLHHFSHIKSLHIYEPTEDLRFLSTFKNLKELYIINTKNIDWTFIASLTKLESLYVKGCCFPDLTPIRDLFLNQGQNFKEGGTATGTSKSHKKISRLYLNQCGIIDISPLEEVNTLTDLTLSQNYITNISSLSKVKHLHYLTLHHNKIKNISPLKSLIKNSRLCYLDIRHNQIEDVSIITENRGENLRYLLLGNNRIKELKQSISCT